MARNKKPASEHRKPFSFTLTRGDTSRLDKLVEQEQAANPYAVITRQTIIEGLLLEYLEKKEAAPHAKRDI